MSPALAVPGRLPQTAQPEQVLRDESDYRRLPEVYPTPSDNFQDMVDDIRQMATDFGTRQYRVFLCHALWGQERGVGTPELRFQELVPTPLVGPLTGVRRTVRATGVTEEGSVQVSRISAGRYTEDDLMGLTPDLRDVADPTRQFQPSSEFFWVVAESRPSWPMPVMRRFVPVAVDRETFEWVVVLEKQDLDTGRLAEDLRHLLGGA